MASKGLKLFTAGTPNGYKVSIFLSALGVPFEYEKIDIMKNIQKEEWYLKMNPNGRIPTLVDYDKNITLSETAAIMTYLADTYDKDRKFSYEVGTPEYYKQLEFVYFQMSGIGATQGQANHFYKFSKEKIPYAIDRFVGETRRLYSVFEEYLKRNEANSPYIIGKHISLADFVTVGWVAATPLIDLDLRKDFPRVADWLKVMLALPAVQKGFEIPSKPFVPFPKV